jgi:hypothetical protein
VGKEDGSKEEGWWSSIASIGSCGLCPALIPALHQVIFDKSTEEARCWWLIPINLATWEAEVWRIKSSWPASAKTSQDPHFNQQVVTVRLLVISTTPEPEIWRNMVLYKTPS